MRIPHIVAVVLGILVLSGCSPSTTPPTATPPTPEASKPTQTSITLDELQELYIEAGGSCDSFAPRSKSAVSEESGDCEDGALLSTYRSTAQRDSAISVLEGAQVTNPSPSVIAVGPDWIVNGADAGDRAEAMGGEPLQIGAPLPSTPGDLDLTTDAGLCAADAEMTGLELNDALAPMLGYSADRDARTPEQDDAIRAHKNEAFLRACPERAM